MIDRRRVASRAAVLTISMMALLATSGLAGGPVDAPDARTGRLAGPIALKPTARLGIVAKVPLTAGNWTVLIKGVFRNTDSVNQAHRAQCRLSIGSTFDTVEAMPRGGDGSNSRVPFMASLSANLAVPGTAFLKCNALGSTAGDVVVERIYASAFKTAALDIGEVGGNLTHFGPTTTFSRVFHRFVPGAVPVVNGPLAEVAQVSLPGGGAWAVTATATLASTGADGFVTCNLTVGLGDRDTTSAFISSNTSDRHPIVLASESPVHPGDVSLRCGTTGAGASLKDIRITLFRGASIHIVVMDPVGTVFFPADAPHPRIAAGFRLGTFTIPVLASTFIKLGGLRLPAGKWVVMATAIITNNSASTAATVLCRLGGGVAADVVELKLSSNRFTGNKQPVNLLMRVNLPQASELTLNCRSAGILTKGTDITLEAFRVGAMLEVDLD